MNDHLTIAQLEERGTVILQTVFEIPRSLVRVRLVRVAVAQRIRRETTNLEIAGSSPAGDDYSGPVGAMDSALDFESSGCGFESHTRCERQSERR